MKKKLSLFLITCLLLYSMTIVFFNFYSRRSAEIIEKEVTGEVVNENTENDNKNDNKNDEVIVNEGDYFFNKTSSQVTINILLSLVAGTLFFLWENDKLPEKEGTKELCAGRDKEYLLCSSNYNVYCGTDDNQERTAGEGIFEKLNWFSLGTFVSLIVITLLVELILHFLIGSISHLFSKDKNKRYFHTLKMSWKKRKQIFSSFSKVKIFFIILSYLLCGLIIAIVARAIVKRIDPCCGEQIIKDHGRKYFLCFWKAKYPSTEIKPNTTGTKLNSSTLQNTQNKNPMFPTLQDNPMSHKTQNNNPTSQNNLPTSQSNPTSQNNLPMLQNNPVQDTQDKKSQKKHIRIKIRTGNINVNTSNISNNTSNSGTENKKKMKIIKKFVHQKNEVSGENQPIPKNDVK